MWSLISHTKQTLERTHVKAVCAGCGRRVLVGEQYIVTTETRVNGLAREKRTRVFCVACMGEE
jgi:hypothetical protein